jgi:HEAT repeats
MVMWWTTTLLMNLSLNELPGLRPERAIRALLAGDALVLLLELSWLVGHAGLLRRGGARAASFARQLGDRLMYGLGDARVRADWVRSVRGVPRALLRAYLEPLLHMTDGEARDGLTAVWRDLGLLEQDLAQSRSWFWTRRLRAVRRLALVAGPAEAPVLLLRRDDHHLIRILAAQTLVRIGTPVQLREFVAQFRLPSRLLEQPLVDVLAATSPDQMFELLQILGTNADPNVQRLVIAGAARVTPGACLSWLPEAFHSPEKEVRIGACQAAGWLGTPEVSRLLLRALMDPAFEVRAHAAEALGRLRAPSTIEPLARALSDVAFWVRQSAATALVAMGDSGQRRLRDVANLARDRFARDTARQELQRLATRLGPRAVS